MIASLLSLKDVLEQVSRCRCMPPVRASAAERVIHTLQSGYHPNRLFFIALQILHSTILRFAIVADFKFINMYTHARSLT